MTIRDAVRPHLFALFLGTMATALAVQALWLTYAAQDFLGRVPEAWPAFLKAGIEGSAFRLAIVVGILSISLLVGSILALVRRGWVLRLIQGACIGGYLVLVHAVSCSMKAVEVYAGTGLPFRGVPGEKARIVYFLMQASVFKWILPALAGLVVVHLFATRRSTINLYTGESGGGPCLSDRLVEDLRTGGADPEYRKCWVMSLGTHAVALLMFPMLFHVSGCATRKHPSPPVVDAGPQRIIVKVVKRQPKTRSEVYNPNSPIAFPPADVFKISTLPADVDRATQEEYVADTRRLLAGVPGAGGKKQGFGMPGGVSGGKLCFLRISFNGDGWRDGLDRGFPSLNLLRAAKKTFPDAKVDYVEKVEPIKALASYRKGHAPPFVYMTGDGRIDIPESELRVLRQYLQDGGMLFADAGSLTFHQAFCAMAARLMPDDRLVALSDDDEIFDMPYFFANGAPPLWHHGGDRAMGVRYKGRLCVFYHPGDLNDAWKTDHSGMDQERTELAFRMGINVMFYAYKHYAQVAAKYRK